MQSNTITVLTMASFSTLFSRLVLASRYFTCQLCGMESRGQVAENRGQVAWRTRANQVAGERNALRHTLFLAL